MRYKIVDDGYTKGIILTAEALMDLEEEVRDYYLSSSNQEQLEGALAVVNLLKSSYRKIK